MSILLVPSRDPFKNSSHHFSAGNAIVYFTVVQILVLTIYTISEELVITQTVGGNQVISFITVIIESNDLKSITFV